MAWEKRDMGTCMQEHIHTGTHSMCTHVHTRVHTHTLPEWLFCQSVEAEAVAWVYVGGA